MLTALKVFIAGVAGLAALTAQTGVAATAVLYGGGIVHVEIWNKDGSSGFRHLELPIPAALAQLGVRFIPQEQWRGAARELKQWAPVAKAALQGLRDTGDGVLVEVEDRKDHFTAAKAGDSILIDVDTPQETVHVSVPLDCAIDLAAQLEAAVR